MVSLCFGVGGKLGSGRERVRQTDRQTDWEKHASQEWGWFSFLEGSLALALLFLAHITCI